MRLFGSNTTLELGTSSLALGLRPRGYEPVTPVMIFSVTVLPLGSQTHHCAIYTFFYVEISAIYWNLYEPSLIYSDFWVSFFTLRGESFQTLSTQGLLDEISVCFIGLSPRKREITVELKSRSAYLIHTVWTCAQGNSR